MEAATVLSSGRWGSPFVSGSPATLTKNGIPCLELNADNKYFEWNVDVGPDSMPIMTLAATFYVNSIPNGRGWLFGDEDGGCDRYMLIHDNRVGNEGVSASCMARSNWHTDGAKVGQWNHMLAHYNQNTRESYVVLNGVKGKVLTGISHGNGRKKLRLGSPWGGHTTDTCVSNVKVFDREPTALEISARAPTF